MQRLRFSCSFTACAGGLQVFLNGQLSGYFDRNEGPETLLLTAPLNPSASASGENATVLDILVSAMGRLNFGCGWDEKGLTGGNVTLDGALLGRIGRAVRQTTTAASVCRLTHTLGWQAMASLCPARGCAQLAYRWYAHAAISS